jgi:hypothetical protein
MELQIVADTELQITAETAGVPEAPAGLPKVRGRPFEKGRSGNPAGRPRGSVNRSTRAAMLLLDGEAEALTRKAVELALAGDPVALRLCLERILGARRGRPVDLAGTLELPPLADAGDLAGAMAGVATAAAQGMITPDEALALAQMVESYTRTLDAAHIARRRRWRGVLYRAWMKKSGGKIEVPW